MREIKLRAWLKEDGFMVDVAEWIHNGRIKVIIQDSGPFLKLPEEIELMQYTGLKDKNGKEIYEGDRLGREMYQTWVVIWDDGSFKIKIEDSPSPVLYFLGQDNLEYREVIGNIYENPESLNENL